MKVKFYLLLILTMGFFSGLKAQINNSDVLFFHYEDNTLKGKQKPVTDPQASFIICRFISGKVYSNKGKYSTSLTGDVISNICRNLKNNINYYENNWNWSAVNGDWGEYDSEMSNSKWTVFRFDSPYIPADQWNSANPAHKVYTGFKNDFSELTEWCEPDVYQRGRYIYKAYTKQELLKMNFTATRDFLQ